MNNIQIFICGFYKVVNLCYIYLQVAPIPYVHPVILNLGDSQVRSTMVQLDVHRQGKRFEMALHKVQICMICLCM